MKDSARLSPLEAAPLLHAVCARAAEDIGIRVLAIKGPIVAMQGLRAARASADIDVLVHPDDLERYADRLREAGWYDAVVISAPRMAPSHALNLLNDRWPLGIDLHHYFPGFLAPAPEVFDALWDRRGIYSLAQFPVPALDPVGQAALTGLHLLRADPEGTGELVRDLAHRALNVLDENGRLELVALAEATDSVVPLRSLFDRMGLTEAKTAQVDNVEGLKAWERRTHLTVGEAWADHLRSIPRWQWPRAVWGAVMVSPQELRAVHGPAGVGVPLWKLRLRRLRTGAKTLPAIFRHVLAKS